MLLQVPKGLGGAKIRTAAVTAAITGTTIMLENIPGKHLKVLVLEGSLRLSMNGKIGDSLLLLPGRMVIMPPDAKRIPDPVSVDLARIMKTSSLVNMGGEKEPLPSVALIQSEIDAQSKNMSRNRLVQTNLVIPGSGTNVLLADDNIIQTLDRKDGVHDMTFVSNRPNATPPPVPSSTPPPISRPTPAVGGTPGPTPSVGGSPTPTPGMPTPTPRPTATPHPSATPRPSASPSPSPTPGGGGDDDDDDSVYDTVLHLGNGNSNVTVNQPIDLSTNGETGEVKANTKGSVTVNSTIKVSESAGPTPSSFGGKIDLRSRKEHGTAINITDSAQLLALLDAAAPGPGGTIRFRSSGGAVNVNGATLRADRGRIDVQNSGNAGVIALNGATLNADTIKVQALGPNGQLNIGGGTMSADTTIFLYAGGSNGTVNFTDNVTLNGQSVKTISGNTVTIRDGKIVTISGPTPANVFTNHPNYTGSGGNNSTTGTFGGAGATTHPLSAGPGPGG
jgi:hypothetical protein